VVDADVRQSPPLYDPGRRMDAKNSLLRRALPVTTNLLFLMRAEETLKVFYKSFSDVVL
jgi:hypothetical protein